MIAVMVFMAMIGSGSSRRAVCGGGRMLGAIHDEFLVSFFDGCSDPDADVCSNHVHETEPHNAFVSLDNNLHTISSNPFSCSKSYISHLLTNLGELLENM